MSTYRVYVLDTKSPADPIVHIAFVSADKYGPAWQISRAALNEAKGSKALRASADLAEPANLGTGDHLVVAKIDDIKPRNVKVDKAALVATLAGDATPEEKLAAMKAALGIA
jgi:hypothetical protein